MNEEANIAACLASLARQTVLDFDAIVVDAGSTDRTVAIVQGLRDAASLPFGLQVLVGPPRMPIGAARNLGVAQASAPNVAFLSADAELDPDWVARALSALGAADMAFGQQVHAPHTWTVGAAVRGLRYRFPTGPTPHPLRHASNVAAAYRRPVLQRFPFDPWANAAEDLLLARRAAQAGATAAYDPGMVVRHHDVSTVGQEMRKNVREGLGLGLYARELGFQWPTLVWGALLLGSLASLALDARLGAVLLAGSIWLPGARRALRRLRRSGGMPRRHVFVGMAASPLFDLAFLGQYVRGLVGSLRSSPRTAPAFAQDATGRASTAPGLRGQAVRLTSRAAHADSRGRR